MLDGQARWHVLPMAPTGIEVMDLLKLVFTVTNSSVSSNTGFPLPWPGVALINAALKKMTQIHQNCVQLVLKLRLKWGYRRIFPSWRWENSNYRLGKFKAASVNDLFN